MNKLLAVITILLISISVSLQAKNKVGNFDHYILALSWQSAFCESKTKKPECRTQSKKHFSAYNFVLHGLWPNNLNYCQVPKRIINKDKRQWCKTPILELSKPVRKQLSQFMPGSLSCLQRHEWYRHGSCSGLSANNYFMLANKLVKKFSKSAFSQYVTKHIGKNVKRKNLLKAFDNSFGKGSRSYLALRCKKVHGISLLTEIQIHLKKDLSNPTKFKHLFPNKKPKIHGTCPRRFKIDEVGISN
jgi:ribonuclease T2